METTRTWPGDPSRQMLELVLDTIPQRVFWKDRDSVFLGCNKALATDLGLDHPDRIIGKTDHDLQPPEVANAFRHDDLEVMASGQARIGYEEPVRRADGSMAWVRTNKVPLRDAQGEVIGVLGAFEDITEQRRLQHDLLLRHRAVEASFNAIVITDNTQPDQPIVYVNPAFERMTGYAAGEVIGRNCRFLLGDDDDQPAVQLLRDAIAHQHEVRVMLRNYRKDGSLFWNDLGVAPVRNDRGDVTHFLGVLNDITQTRRYQEQLEHQATHDTLTGLPNRSVLMDRLQQALVQARAHGQPVTVVLVDIDGLKHINDGLGHNLGDEVLAATACRLKAGVRPTDTAARLGGDSFVLILSEPMPDEALPIQLQTLLDSVAAPLHVEGRELYVTATLGVSRFPDDGEDAATLLSRADMAMYRAKEVGGHAFEFYGADMGHRLTARLSMLSALRHAVQRDELLLHYQPRVDLRDGTIVGVEALVRWRSPTLGLVSPGDFIPLAEESGLIEPIGEWVLRTACHQAMAWAEGGLTPVQMAVNLSARQFRRRDLAAWIAGVLRDTHMPPCLLELELTESMLMTDAKAAAQTMADLKQLGVQLAIDDFGTGYSSLSYLKRFPVDHLKIDRSFVSELTVNADDAAIARTVIALARTLNMRVVAEGVETEAQADFLRGEDCDEMQGYHFSRPLPAEQCEALIRRVQGAAAVVQTG